MIHSHATAYKAALCPGNGDRFRSWHRWMYAAEEATGEQYQYTEFDG